MKKVVIFVKKRKDITMQQFKDHIVNRHSVIEKKLWKVSPWVKKGTRSFIIPDTSFPQGSGEEPLFDAMFELYMDPEYQGNPFDLSEEGHKCLEELYKDEENFIDLSAGRVPPNYIIYMVDEEVIDEK